MFSMLLEDISPVPEWVSNSFPIIRIVLFCIVVAAALILIATTLFQAEDAKASDAILGQQESYYAQNKGSSRNEKLKRITIIVSIIAAVCIVLYFVSFLIFPAGA